LFFRVKSSPTLSGTIFVTDKKLPDRLSGFKTTIIFSAAKISQTKKQQLVVEKLL